MFVLSSSDLLFVVYLFKGLLVPSAASLARCSAATTRLHTWLGKQFGVQAALENNPRCKPRPKQTNSSWSSVSLSLSKSSHLNPESIRKLHLELGVLFHIKIPFDTYSPLIFLDLPSPMHTLATNFTLWSVNWEMTSHHMGLSINQQKIFQDLGNKYSPSFRIFLGFAIISFNFC